jgi:hypothetical protein
MAVPGASGLLAQRPTAHGPTAPTQQIAAGAAYLADPAWPRPPPFFVCGRAPCQVPSAKKPPCGRPNTLGTTGYWPWPHAMPCGPASGGSAPGPRQTPVGRGAAIERGHLPSANTALAGCWPVTQASRFCFACGALAYLQHLDGS